VIALALLLGVFTINTQPIAVNDGFGYDGLHYARLTLSLREGSTLVLTAPYAYRVLPAEIVARSGMDIRAGFFVLNAAALLAAGLVILALLRRRGATPLGALTAVVWFGLLPFGLRQVLHVPVGVDALALLLLLGLSLASLSDRYVTFGIVLIAAALTRENLLLMAPFLWLRGAAERRLPQAVLATVPAFAAIGLVYLMPPVPPAAIGPGSVDFIGYHAYVIAANTDADAWRVVLGLLLALGPLLGIAIARLNAVRAVIRNESGWLFFLVSGFVATTLGGLDHDRYDVWFLPFLLIVAFAGTDLFDRPRVALPLTLLMALGLRALVPLGADESSHFAFFVATMPAADLARNALIPACCSVAATVFCLVAARPR